MAGGAPVLRTHAGATVATLLDDRFGLVPEMTAVRSVVFALGPGTDRGDGRRLVDAYATLLEVRRVKCRVHDFHRHPGKQPSTHRECLFDAGRRCDRWRQRAHDGACRGVERPQRCCGPVTQASHRPPLPTRAAGIANKPCVNFVLLMSAAERRGAGPQSVFLSTLPKGACRHLWCAPTPRAYPPWCRGSASALNQVRSPPLDRHGYPPGSLP